MYIYRKVPRGSIAFSRFFPFCPFGYVNYIYIYIYTHKQYRYYIYINIYINYISVCTRNKTVGTLYALWLPQLHPSVFRVFFTPTPSEPPLDRCHPMYFILIFFLHFNISIAYTYNNIIVALQSLPIVTAPRQREKVLGQDPGVQIVCVCGCVCVRACERARVPDTCARGRGLYDIIIVH